MKNIFRVKLVRDTPERTYGIALRLFGVDFMAVVLGWLDDWRVVDLRIPCNMGVFCQVAFAAFNIGRLPDDSVYTN